MESLLKKGNGFVCKVQRILQSLLKIIFPKVSYSKFHYTKYTCNTDRTIFIKHKLAF